MFQNVSADICSYQRGIHKTVMFRSEYITCPYFQQRSMESNRTRRYKFRNKKKKI